MLDRVLALLKAPGGDPVQGPASDLALAVAALLVEAASIDGCFEAAERAAILRLLARRFDLDAAAAQGLLDRAERRQAGATQLLRFTRAIKDALGEGEREDLLELVWEVILADGRVDDLEANLVRRLAGLIYVSDQASGAARKRAEARIAGTQGSSGGPWGPRAE